MLSAGPSIAQSPTFVRLTASGSALLSTDNSNATMRDSSDFSPFSRSCGWIVDVVGSEDAQARTRRDYAVCVRYHQGREVLRWLLTCFTGAIWRLVQCHITGSFDWGLPPGGGTNDSPSVELEATQLPSSVE